MSTFDGSDRADPMTDGDPMTAAHPMEHAEPMERRVQSPEHRVFGRAVREARARRDLSQERLGFKCGLHRNYVGAIERGEINPTLKVLLKLATGLTLPLSELFALFEQRREELKR